MGLRSSLDVSRSASWTLPDHAVIYLAEVGISRSLQPNPRLRLELNRVLETEVQERFARYRMADAGQSLHGSLSAAAFQNCDLLLQLSLQDVHDNLSSVTEWRNDRGFMKAKTGRDRLSLVLKIFDVRSGRLLDTLSVHSRSGVWRWREHPVTELLEPALAAMFEQLRVRQVAHHQQ